MKIVIDTKEDIHILRHVIQLLHAVSSAAGMRKSYEDNSNLYGSSSYSSSSSSLPSNSAPPVADAAPLFGMFDSPSTSSSSSSSDSFNSIFPGLAEKKDDNNKGGDFLDSLQVY